MKPAADKAFSVDTPEESTGFLLWQVTNLWQREIRKALAQHDLTHSQFVLLASIMWLSQYDKPITQIVLSAHTKIDPMTTSTVLRTLQAKGLVARKEHATDTRAKTVALTQDGEQVTRQAIRVVEAFDNAFFKPLAKDTADFNARLLQLLSWQISE